MNTTNNKEIRKAEIRTQDGRSVSGYAVRFESESLNMGFIEVIHRGAITNETIAESDIFALLNHNENVVLARSNHGTGSLTLSVDENGVFYQFEAPNTNHGDELLEHIKRGEISQSSFAFSVSPEDGAEKWTKREDGTILREIFKIARLYDISPVYQPAYTATTCSQRALDKIEELNNMDNNEVKELTPEMEEIEMLKARIAQLESELQKADEEPTDEAKEGEQRTDSEDEKKDEKEPENESENTEINNVDEESENDSNTTESESEDTNETTNENDSEDEENDKNKTNRNISNMENFSLTKEIRKAMADGTNKIDMRAYTVTDEGADVVQTDVFDIWAPLREKNVLVDAGARVLTGLKNNAQIPVFGKTEAKFANEIANASDGSGAISSVKLSPKRITAKVPISLELLAQDNVGVEAMIREDIANAVYAAVEDKAFGKQAESTDVFKGLLNGVANASIYDVSTFNAVCTMEAAVETANVNPNDCKYVVSPTGKAHLRALPKSAKTTELTMQNGEIDGTEVLSTGHLIDTSINVIYGDFSNVVIGTWDNVQIDMVRDTASLSAGQVNLVVNAYVDLKCIRPEGFAFGKA